MANTVFPLRMQPQLKEAIRDRAKIENRSQNDLINSVIKLYLSDNPYRQKTAS